MFKVNRFVWFEKWVVGKRTLDQLVTEIGLSRRTIYRFFKGYLKEASMMSVYPSERVNLFIGSTYFTNDLGLIMYRDNTIKITPLYRLSDRERYEDLIEDLENLLVHRVQIESVTRNRH